jgi:hypothetical protein
MPQAFGLNILTQFNQPMWGGGNVEWLATSRGDPFMRFSLVATPSSASVALPLEIWDNPLPPDVHSRSWRLVSISFLTGTNCLSQGVSHRIEGCVVLGWNLAGVVNDPRLQPANLLLKFQQKAGTNQW